MSKLLVRGDSRAAYHNHIVLVSQPLTATQWLSAGPLLEGGKRWPRASRVAIREVPYLHLARRSCKPHPCPLHRLLQDTAAALRAAAPDAGLRLETLGACIWADWWMYVRRHGTGSVPLPTAPFGARSILLAFLPPHSLDLACLKPTASPSSRHSSLPPPADF